MKRILLSLTFLVLASGQVFGVEEETILKEKDTNSLDFQKLVMEQNLQARVRAAIGPLFQEARYDLSVSVNYKIYKGTRRKAANNEIELDKYGVVAPGVSQAELKTDLINNIGWINVKLIAYDHIAEEKVALFNDIAMKVVDMVDPWRVRVQVVNPPAPAASSVQPAAPTTTVPTSIVWALFGFAVFVCTLIFSFFFFRSRRPEQAQYARPHFETAATHPEHAHYSEPKKRHAHYSAPAESMTFTPSAEPLEAEFSEFQEVSETPVSQEKFADEKHESTVPSEQVADVFELLAKSDANSEKHIFEALMKSGQTDLLKEAAQTYYPAELIFSLNPEILSAALDLMPVNDRMSLILCSEQNESWVLINCLNEKAKAYMEHELEKHKSNSTVKLEIRRNGPRYRKTFVDLVRQVISTNQEYTRLAQPQLDEWLQRKSGGVRDVS
jgi:hypothetical protein